MNKNITIVSTIDRKYLMPFTVMLTSLLENSRLTIQKYYLLTTYVPDNELLSIISFFKTRYSTEIVHIYADVTVLKNAYISNHISIATYIRLLLGDLLPLDIEKVLFLDADLVVLGDISELQKYSEETQTIHAVDHMYTCQQFRTLRRIGFLSSRYFNAGVMIMNLSYIRTNKMSCKFIETMSKFESKLAFWDQDVLNINYQDSWGELPLCYNAYGVTKRMPGMKIIHFTGSSKPWHYHNKHPYKKEFWKYLSMTPYKNFKFTDKTPITILRKMIPDPIFYKVMKHITTT